MPNKPKPPIWWAAPCAAFGLAFWSTLLTGHWLAATYIIGCGVCAVIALAFM